MVVADDASGAVLQRANQDMQSPWTASNLDALDAQAVEIKRGLMACAANPNASNQAATSTAIAQFVEHLKLIVTFPQAPHAKQRLVRNYLLSTSCNV